MQLKLGGEERRERGAPQQRCGLASVSLLVVTFLG